MHTSLNTQTKQHKPMNYTYLSIMLILTLVSFVLIYKGGLGIYADGTHMFMTLITTIAAIFAIILSFAMGGKTTSVTKPATVTHVGNLLVIHSSELGTHTTSDISFLDKNVTLTLTTLRSAWGYKTGSDYSVNIAPSLPKDTSPRINETSMRQQLQLEAN